MTVNGNICMQGRTKLKYMRQRWLAFLKKYIRTHSNKAEALRFAFYKELYADRLGDM